MKTSSQTHKSRRHLYPPYESIACKTTPTTLVVCPNNLDSYPPKYESCTTLVKHEHHMNCTITKQVCKFFFSKWRYAVRGCHNEVKTPSKFLLQTENSKEGKQWPMYEHHHISNIQIEMNQRFESAAVYWWSAYSCPRICEHVLQAFVTDLLCTALTPQLNIHGGCIVWGSTSQPP